MITEEQALQLQYRTVIHYGKCIQHIGSRGGIYNKQVFYRVSGRIHT